MATTHIICILDRSGSMAAQAPEVITNFNTFLKEQKEVEGKAKLTLVLFDGEYEIVHNMVRLKNVPELTSDTYFTRGATAMNDAIGRTLSSMESKKNAIVLIHTDGYENASREWTYDSVKNKIDKLKKKWEFIFVGGEINAAQIGSSLGIHKTVTVNNNMKGMQDSYAAFTASTVAYRSGSALAETDAVFGDKTGAIDINMLTTTGDAKVAI